MKFTCNSFDLSDACQIVQRATSAKTAFPSVEGILLVAENGALTLTGYDLEMGITTTIPCNIEESGKVVVNAHMFSETVRKLPDKPVHIDSDARQIAEIECGEFKTKIIGMSAEEYPELPSITAGYDLSLSQPLIKDMIKKTIFSAAVKDAKVIHTGVKFEIEDNHIRLIAVDGVRLAIRNENIDYTGDALSFVVPAKTLNEVMKLLSDGEENVSISVGKRHIIFRIGGYDIISRLLDGDFLNYKSAIPSSTKTVVSVDTMALLESIDRTSLILADRLKSPIKCVFANNTISLSSNASIGASSDKLDVEIQGDDCTIGFNNKYMLDVLRVCDTDKVRIMLNGPVAPILVVPSEGDSFIFLILPVRLKNED
ncbi:MAG: DNA polymerase III subunit beta [Clostridia bacterium]|nr:DNA polymerase III subunit beta [Clostridia bacterium]MBR4451392.1 DNA polymerase III subunit beta [Clostridia bacterium]